MASNPSEWFFGKNTFRFEPPDRLEGRFQGECSLEEATRAVELYQQLATVRPFFMLADLSVSKGMDAEAKRYVSDHLQPDWFQGIIYFQTRLVHRAIAKGLLLAYELTRMDLPSMRGKVHFVSTRAEAQALYAQLSAQRGPLGVRSGSLNMDGEERPGSSEPTPPADRSRPR